MNGAIFFSSKYGSTERYANWISDRTGLPVFNIPNTRADPSEYDFLVIGSPIYYYKTLIRKWVKKHLVDFEKKPVIFFTVSGAPAGPQLDGWIANCLPASFISRAKHVALRGRLQHDEISLFHSLILKFAASRNKDPEARKEELEGFDYMDRSSIDPIVKFIRQFQLGETKVSSQQELSQARSN